MSAVRTVDARVYAGQRLECAAPVGHGRIRAAIDASATPAVAGENNIDSVRLGYRRRIARLRTVQRQRFSLRPLARYSIIDFDHDDIPGNVLATNIPKRQRTIASTEQLSVYTIVIATKVYSRRHHLTYRWNYALFCDVNNIDVY